MVVLLAIVALLVGFLAGHKFGLGVGDACQPEEVLAALQWEVTGQYANGRFTGRHRDRGIEIVIRSFRDYWIAIEGVPEMGDLEGRDAVARIEALAKTPDALKLADIPDWEAIVRVFHAHPFRFEGGRLIATASFGGGVLGPHEEAQRLKRLLDRLVEVTKVAQVVFSLRARLEQDTRCPYCHDEFSDALQTTECPKCGARHHVDCFVEHGKCAVFACSALVPQGLRDLAGPGKPKGGSIRSV